MRLTFEESEIILLLIDYEKLLQDLAEVVNNLQCSSEYVNKIGNLQFRFWGIRRGIEEQMYR